MVAYGRFDCMQIQTDGSVHRNSRRRSFKFMKYVTLCQTIFFLANSWERLAFSINVWYTCKYCTAFKLLSFSKQVPFAISNTWGTNSLKCCEHSINILVLRHWHTRIECDFGMFYHRVYFLNVRLKSWLSILLIFKRFSLVILPFPRAVRQS